MLIPPLQTFVIIFWVMGPRTPGSETFLNFNDDNGWGSAGLAVHVTRVYLTGPH